MVELDLGTHRFQRAELIERRNGFDCHSRQTCTLEAVRIQLMVCAV